MPKTVGKSTADDDDDLKPATYFAHVQSFAI